MAGLIRRSDIDEVRARTNIADIVSDHVQLKNAGVGSMKGLCPFHDERSPSFHVRPQVGRYHCFGCGEDGDVFSFLQRMEHVSFQEAVERLAGRLGYTLQYEDGGEARSDHSNRARLLAANRAAAEFYRVQLGSPEAETARRFLQERGFDQAAAEHFGVGFAPRSYEATHRHLRAEGFREEELLEAGLMSQGQRGAYDRFRGRLIWPIRDVTGQTLGFGARKLFDDDPGPKYLNTPETPIYHKSQVLYGIDLARKEVSRDRRVVIVEGYTDVMACHLAGVTSAVATCGTSFGVDHIKMLRRMMGDVDNANVAGTGEVVFTFDPDEAGQRAASRAFQEEKRFAAQTFVAVPPEGLDPCDLRLHRGDEAVRALVRGRKPMFEFMIRRALEAHDLETVEGRVSALRAAAPVLAGIRDRALSNGYERSLAGWLGVDPGEVHRAVRSAGAAARAAESRGEEPARAGEAGTAVAAPPAPPSLGLADLPRDPVTGTESYALMVLLQHPALVPAHLAGFALGVAFRHPALEAVKHAILAAGDPGGDWVGRVVEQAPQPLVRLVQELGAAPVPARSEADLPAYCAGVVGALVDMDLLRRKSELLGALQRTSAAGDPERYRALQRDLVDVEQQRRALRES